MTPEEQRRHELSIRHSDAITEIRKSLAERAHPVKVLVIDDNRNDAELALNKLQSFGVDAAWVKDNNGVQTYLRENDPFLVFLDLNLGAGFSGLTVLDFMLLMRPNVKVVVLTGEYMHDAEECKEALRKGAKFVKLKPLTHDDVRLLFSAP